MGSRGGEVGNRAQMSHGAKEREGERKMDGGGVLSVNHPRTVSSCCVSDGDWKQSGVQTKTFSLQFEQKRGI